MTIDIEAVNRVHSEVSPEDRADARDKRQNELDKTNEFRKKLPATTESASLPKIKIVTPQVFVVGITTPDYVEIDRFFDETCSSLKREGKQEDHDEFWDPYWIQKGEGVPAEDLSELGGRICYQSFGKGQGSTDPKKYFENILSSRHGSVLEHVVVNLVITGISRSLSLELVRHRAGLGISQLSQRYVDETDTAFVIPEAIADDPTSLAIWEESMQRSLQDYIKLSERLTTRITILAESLYGPKEHEPKEPCSEPRRRTSEELVEAVLGDIKHTRKTITEIRKEARQAARSVLPNSVETRMSVTANARALRHICELRGSRFAEPEIRALAIALTIKLKKLLPNIFQDFAIKEEVNAVGKNIQVTSCEYSKV